ncbi:MAG: hypothetical protein ACT4OX_16050, partial [Actinomycetota bacterium]
RPFASRCVVAAATIGTYAVVAGPLDATTSTVGALIALVEAALMAVLTQDVLARRGELEWRHRLADLALVTCGPLAALGAAHPDGLGLGALAILVVPLALLAHGFGRNQQAHTNLFAWLHAASVAPEYAGLVSEGRAPRVARYARQLAETVGLDETLTDQLEAAAWMERVGECCLDESYISGFPHTREEIVEESAAILKSTKAFYDAGQILWAQLNEPELATDTAVDRAGQILRVVIAFEDLTDGQLDVSLIPGQFARLRTSTYHPLDRALCDTLQQLVAPRSPRSTWTPPQTHASISCGCVVAVDEYAFAGDEHPCAHHGEQTIDDLAVDRIRTHLDTAHQRALELIGGAQAATGNARELQRELYTRLVGDENATDILTAVARAGYDTGTAWEHSIAQWLREAGAPPQLATDILAGAGTPEFDAFQALRDAYSTDELEHPDDHVLPGPTPLFERAYTAPNHPAVVAHVWASPESVEGC